MSLPILTSRSRVMMFAPHPDDESLAAGVFLQRAIAAGASVRIVYATDGERNGWPQRVLERKLRIRDSDRFRWGARRQAEALAALDSLGIAPAHAQFLSLPDQGITDLLLAGCRATTARLAEIITRWRPTHLLLPSAADTHPDHSALAVLLGIVLDHHLALHPAPLRLHYLVHGASLSFEQKALELAHGGAEEKAKRRAIGCHVTQVALSRRRFFSYAKRPERFVLTRENLPPVCEGAIREVVRARDQLRVQVSVALKPLRAEATTLFLLGHDRGGELRRLRTILPARSAPLHLLDCESGAIAGLGHYRGNAFEAEISLPTSGFANARSLFLKLDRRVWFFDEAGWLEVAPATVSRPAPRLRPAAESELAVA